LDHELPINDRIIISMKQSNVQYSMENGYEAAKELLASGESFTALYAIADTLAIGACRAFIEAGKKIPDDYSIMGFDGIEHGKYSTPSLTTLKQPVEEMAKATVDLLFDILSGKKGHDHKIFAGELVIRESTSEI